jgi:hypothetical protein
VARRTRISAQEDLSGGESTEGGRDSEVADRATGTTGEVGDEAGIFLSKKKSSVRGVV